MLRSTAAPIVRCLVRCSSLTALTGLCLALTHAQAQSAPTLASPTPAQIDAIFKTWERRDSPGCALAVVRDGQIVYSRGYGMANLEHDIPLSPSSVFQIASVSKQFTAMSAIMLEQQGKLSLEDDVRKYVPEMHDFGKPLRLRHLIHHTSGLRDQFDLLEMAGWGFSDAITQDDLLSLAYRQRELNFEPGSEYLYCNTGYTLLAEVVKRVTGSTLRQYARQTLFLPLGMTNTHVHDDSRLPVKNRAYSYNPRREGFGLAIQSSSEVGATNLFTSVEDLARWDRNFIDPRVGGPPALDVLLRKGRLNSGREINYAGGLSVGTYRGLPTVGHGGVHAGYRTHFLRFPQQRFTVILLANLSSIVPSPLARQVANLYLEPVFPPAPPAPEKPASMPPRKVEASLLDAYAGTYRIRAGLSRTFVRDGERLLMMSDGNRVPMLAHSDNEFTAEGFTARYRFRREGSGKAMEVSRTDEGEELIGRRVEPAKPTPEDLQACTGRFYSPELDVLYTLERREDRLFVRHRRGEHLLKPATADEWESSLATFTFTRDKKKRIDGFLLNTSRSRNLRFWRAEIKLPASREKASE